MLARLDNLAPEANASIRLLLATHWIIDDFHTPCRINIGPLATHLLLEIARRLQIAAPAVSRVAVATASSRCAVISASRSSCSAWTSVNSAKAHPPELPGRFTPGAQEVSIVDVFTFASSPREPSLSTTRCAGRSVPRRRVPHAETGTRKGSSGWVAPTRRACQVRGRGSARIVRAHRVAPPAATHNRPVSPPFYSYRSAADPRNPASRATPSPSPRSW